MKYQVSLKGNIVYVKTYLLNYKNLRFFIIFFFPHKTFYFTLVMVFRYSIILKRLVNRNFRFSEKARIRLLKLREQNLKRSKHLPSSELVERLCND